MATATSANCRRTIATMGIDNPDRTTPKQRKNSEFVALAGRKIPEMVQSVIFVKGKPSKGISRIEFKDSIPPISRKPIIRRFVTMLKYLKGYLMNKNLFKTTVHNCHEDSWRNSAYVDVNIKQVDVLIWKYCPKMKTQNVAFWTTDDIMSWKAMRLQRHLSIWFKSRSRSLAKITMKKMLRATFITEETCKPTSRVISIVFKYPPATCVAFAS